MVLAGLKHLLEAEWLAINLTAVADLDDQHAHPAVLYVADYPDVADTIAPVVS